MPEISTGHLQHLTMILITITAETRRVMTSFGTQNAGSAIAQGAKGSPIKRRGAVSGQRSKPKVPDQAVREIRALAEFKDWDAPKLAKKYGLTDYQVRRILLGYTAAYVVHSVSDVPSC